MAEAARDWTQKQFHVADEIAAEIAPFIKTVTA
jgi:hypothetical protein